MKIKYYVFKVLSKLLNDHQYMIRYYRSKGCKIGDHCLICSNIITPESQLISIGNNVTVSTNVAFVTHDNSIKLVLPEKSDLFGCIKIGNNCFIGENSTILYGCSLGDNIIVAAGSVVTKSWSEKNIIIGGNPAHKIGDWNSLRSKYQEKAVNRKDVNIDMTSSFLVKR